MLRLLLFGILAFRILRQSCGIKLDENSTTARIWAHLKSKGGALLLERPGEGKGKPDHVTVSLFIQHIRAVDELKMELMFDIFFRYYWYDDRVAYDEGPARISLPTRLAMNQIWMPDLFLVNAHDVSLHDALDANSGVFITRGGMVTVSSRLSLTTHCNMNLRKFPHDRHLCGLSIESYMFTNDSVKLRWGSVTLKVDHAPSAFKTSYRNKTITSHVFNHGVYDRAEVAIDLSRISDYYVVFIYAPSIGLVVLSMVLFWLPLSAILERTFLAGLLLCCLIGIFMGSQHGCPHVGYCKAIDIWLLICFIFVLLSLLEVIIILLLVDRDMLTKPGDQFELMREGEPSKMTIGKPFGIWSVRANLVQKIDTALRVVLPALFVLFNAIYWPVCGA